MLEKVKQIYEERRELPLTLFQCTREDEVQNSFAISDLGQVVHLMDWNYINILAGEAKLTFSYKGQVMTEHALVVQRYLAPEIFDTYIALVKSGKVGEFFKLDRKTKVDNRIELGRILQ